MSENERAQGIHCGGLAVALPYSWARGVVDEFELSGVPNAPRWLAGAANVEGRIVAVVDLAAWAEPLAQDMGVTQATPARSRLLLGGDGTEAFALRFQGLPALLHCQAEDCEHSLPASLHAHLRGSARAQAGTQSWPLLDIQGLAQRWADELAQ